MGETRVLVLKRKSEPRGERVRLLPSWHKPTGEILSVSETMKGTIQVVAMFDLDDLKAAADRIEREAPEHPEYLAMFKKNAGIP